MPIFCPVHATTHKVECAELNEWKSGGMRMRPTGTIYRSGYPYHGKRDEYLKDFPHPTDPDMSEGIAWVSQPEVPRPTVFGAIEPAEEAPRGRMTRLVDRLRGGG